MLIQAESGNVPLAPPSHFGGWNAHLGNAMSSFALALEPLRKTVPWSLKRVQKDSLWTLVGLFQGSGPKGPGGHCVGSEWDCKSSWKITGRLEGVWFGASWSPRLTNLKDMLAKLQQDTSIAWCHLFRPKSGKKRQNSSRIACRPQLLSLQKKHFRHHVMW